MRRIATLTGMLIYIQMGYSQCITTNINGNYTQSSDIILSGVINVTGTYLLPAGVTITVSPFTTDSCGSLTINAKKIEIIGTINGDNAGYPGGSGGAGATSVTSITGHSASLTTCNDKDNPGQITVGGGQFGMAGSGPGGGSAGGNGTAGSGSKQECQTSGDKGGMVAGSGGAGGGAGGSYGGLGTNGLSGGNGAATATINGFSFSSAYTPLAGNGGMGGSTSTTYGTISGTDIDLGSGGGGAGGGGRSYYAGEAGLKGGNGGGMVKLVASDTLIVTGIISVNGENGKQGGKGGNGDKSPDCCSDLCNDCGERTFSAGAGGGGGSGAGSGGGIYLESGKYAHINATLSANGGEGGNPGNAGTGVSCNYDTFGCGTQNVTTANGSQGSSGGSGSGGRVKIKTTDCPTNIISPTITVNGGTGAENGSMYEATIPCQYAGIEFEGEINAVLFPNPASDQLSFRINAYSVGMSSIELQLIDATGRILSASQHPLFNGQVITLPVGHLSAGIYTLLVKNNYLVKNYPFIIQ